MQMQMRPLVLDPALCLSTDGDTLSGIRISDTFRDIDGGRRFRIRYDTPGFSGFTFSASCGEEILAEDDNASHDDLGLRSAYESDLFKADAGIGYDISTFLVGARWKL